MARDIYSEVLETGRRNHYELLGLKLFETDQESIHKASLSQMKKLKAWDLHEDEETARQIKELHIKLSQAIGELQDVKKKLDYDKVLAFEMGREVPYLPSELEKLNNMETIQILTKICPGCDGISLDKDAICIQCGYNFDSGKKLSTEIEHKVETEDENGKESSSVTIPGKVCNFLKSFLSLRNYE